MDRESAIDGGRSSARAGAGLWVAAACLALALWGLAGPRPAGAQQLVLSEHRLSLRADTLMAHLEVDSLFSSRSMDAIASGMTTSISVELRLEGGRGFRTRQRTVVTLLMHDIWEGRYQAIRHGGRSDTLVTGDFAEAEAFCSVMPRVDLGPLPADRGPYVLKMRVSVDPISEAQRRRTRNWLNFLDRGSILELFISLDTPTERTDWLEVRRFRREDLP